MKTLSAILLVLSTFMALAIADLSSTPLQEEKFFNGDRVNSKIKNTRNPASLRVIRPTAMLTCDQYPKVCRVRGSPGPDCCKKRCVDTSDDRLNCGMCGKKCKFSEMCCKGKCVSPRSDERNCGGCDIRCRKGNSCVYGMCSYGSLK